MRFHNVTPMLWKTPAHPRREILRPHRIPNQKKHPESPCQPGLPVRNDFDGVPRNTRAM